MSTNRPPILDAWDDLTRDVRPPSRPRVRSDKTLTTVAPLLLGAIVIGSIAIVPSLLQGPASFVGVTPGPASSSVMPQATDARIRRMLRRVEGVSISEDRLTVRIEFTGSGPAGPYDPRNFDPERPCSEGYEVTAKVAGDRLEIGVYSLLGIRPTSTTRDGLQMACVLVLVGYPQSITVRLDEPFMGNVVRDLAGQTFHLAPPDWLAKFGALPEGWRLREEGDSLGDYPRWKRTWSPVLDPDPLEDPFLELFQSHDGPVQVEGGNDRSDVEVNGRPAELQFDPRFGFTGFGEMVLLWSIDGDGFALVATTRDFSRQELIALAESISLPTGSRS